MTEHRETDWRKLIAEVRTVYDGPVGICCNCIPALRELYVCFASTFRFEGFSTLKAYATSVSAIISCLRCADRLTLSIAPIYTQLMMVAVPPLLMNGSG